MKELREKSFNHIIQTGEGVDAHEMLIKVVRLSDAEEIIEDQVKILEQETLANDAVVDDLQSKIRKLESKLNEAQLQFLKAEKRALENGRKLEEEREKDISVIAESLDLIILGFEREGVARIKKHFKPKTTN